MSFKQLIEEEVVRPLSYEDLERILPSWCGFKRYDDLAKYKTLDQAMGGKDCMAVLYNIHDKATHRTVNAPGHFILLNRRSSDNKTEYFSSTGWKPGQEIAVTHSDPNIFSRLLGQDFVYNSVPYQKDGNMNDCWRWIMCRATLGHMPLKSFQRLFSQNFIPRDSNDLVTAMTLLQTIENDLQ